MSLSAYQMFNQYHSLFQGNTRKACASCGGKCEIYKIAALLPGEKEFMASHLKMEVEDFEERYLDCLDTPFGSVDVLKMKDGCEFLDSKFRCTAVPVKPIMCDCYPIIFNVKGSNLNFKLDEIDCPMVHHYENESSLRDFARDGINALRKLDVPLEWWRMVMIFDGYDYDYVRIEQELRQTSGYETFLLEELFGYTCNGYEKRARREGLRLLSTRLRNALKKALNQIEKGEQRRILTNQLTNYINDGLRKYAYKMAISINEARENKVLLTEANAAQYLMLVSQVKEVVTSLEAPGEIIAEQIFQGLADDLHFRELSNSNIRFIERNRKNTFSKGLTSRW